MKRLGRVCLPNLSDAERDEKRNDTIVALQLVRDTIR